MQTGREGIFNVLFLNLGNKDIVLIILKLFVYIIGCNFNVISMKYFRTLA